MQPREATFVKKSSFSPLLISLGKKKKNEECLGRERRFPPASSWPVEMLKSQVGSSQGEALPGFTPLNLRDVSSSRR